MADFLQIVFGIALIGLGSVMAALGTTQTTTYSTSSTYLETTVTFSYSFGVCCGPPGGGGAMSTVTSSFSYPNVNQTVVPSTTNSYTINYLGAVFAVMGLVLITSGLWRKKSSVYHAVQMS
jgi:hypothetical protein